jgi:thioredoxin reductase (NADPH)
VRPVDEIRIVGHRWSAECFAARDFLARNSVPYRYYSIDEPEGARLLEAAGATEADVPLLVTTDGTALRAPTDAEIAAACGLTTDPATDFYDLIVIGGGPAGLGSAVYGASEGLRTVLVERQATGGQAGQSRASRTTSASPTACPARSSPTGRAGRRPSSGPRCSPRATSSRSRPAARRAW